MNIILPNDCFEVFSRQGSHLITYRYVNPRAFLARAGHNIFHMRGLSSLQQIWNPKHFLKCFSPPLSVYLLKSSAAAFGVLAARGQGANIQSASELGGTKTPHVCVSLSVKETLVFRSCRRLASLWCADQVLCFVVIWRKGEKCTAVFFIVKPACVMRGRKKQVILSTGAPLFTRTCTVILTTELD